MSSVDNFRTSEVFEFDEEVRLKVLVKIREVNEGTVEEEEVVVVVVSIFLGSGFRSEIDGRRSESDGRRSVNDGRLVNTGVSARVRVINPLEVGSGVVVRLGIDEEVGGTAVGLLMFEIEGLEQLNIFRSRVGVAGIEGSVLVVFVEKLVCLDTAGTPL
jgi:hypothetical protein